VSLSIKIVRTDDQSAAMALFTISCMAFFIGTVASTSVRTPWEKEQEREVKLISVTYSNGEVQDFRAEVQR